MRGSVLVSELLHSYSHEDREFIYKVVKDNLEMSKDFKMPLL